LHGKFDEMVDAVLGSSTAPVVTGIVKPTVEAWAIPLKDIYDNEDMRLDATHYDRQAALALAELKRCKCPLKPLSNFAEIRLPGLFARIWAKSIEYGVPYVNATDLMSLTALGVVEDTRYLSRETDVEIDNLIIHEGWLALTCSGTIGRVFYIPARLDGWVATHDLIRIIPQNKNTTGFLHSYLSSPLAQSQILGYTYGGQIDHVTDVQIGNILVPVLPPAKLEEIHEKTMRALRAREQAIQSIAEVAEDLKKFLKK
jgi:type I restriction enzyme S subunit